MEPLLGNTEDAMESGNVYTKQQRIAQLAELHPQLSFTSLAYHVDLEWLKEAYRRTRKSAAAGVDGVTAQEYEQDLEGNLRRLLERFKSGQYVAPPVRRVYIPKGDGKQERPIGIPTLEDKVLQRAVVMLLTPIYEHDFLDCSYGFRPKRKQHDALERLWKSAMGMGGGWVLEVDIRKYFETVQHEPLRQALRQRVSDGTIGRMVGKWLKAGVMQDGSISYPDEGTPQGGVISPLLSNIYLHEALDTWFERDIRPRLTGRVQLIRFADDVVILFEQERDARRVAEVLPKRLARYGLTLHPKKTRIIRFAKPGKEEQDPEHCDFLGVRHYWGKSRKGRWVVKRKTAKGRLRRAIRKVWEWCRRNRHEPVHTQQEQLNRKVQGHYGYYGITPNMRSLQAYHRAVERTWRYWLNRRSRTPSMPWARFRKVLERYPLAMPRIVHSSLANP